MAAKRTIEQINTDKIIKKKLNDLGETIYQETRDTTRVKTGQLLNSINYAVKPDKVLTVWQVYYGSFVKPKGKETGENNALLITVNKHIPESIKIIVKEINDIILKPFKK
jgi:hypothetical protein